MISRRDLSLIFLLLMFLVQHPMLARTFNDRILNRPYADLRAWHLGFSVGMHFQDITFSHTGEIAVDGTEWYMDQPSVSPGFCINGLIDFRLSRWCDIRLSPGLYFGSKEIKMREVGGELSESQTIKSTYVVVPMDFKISSLRYRNSKPYIAAGLMPVFDISRKRSDFLELKSADCYLTFSIGCDFYLPYFKLIPEIKFCLGLVDILRHNRPDLEDNPLAMRFTDAIKRAASSMVVLSFYFE